MVCSGDPRSVRCRCRWPPGCAPCSPPTYRSPPTTCRSTPIPEIGNNALLRDALGLEPDGRPFGEAKGSAVGAIGRASEPIDVRELRRRLAEAVGQEPLVFEAGPDRISSVGIVTGGGAFAVDEAGRLGLDALVTGEPSEPVMGESREYGVHFLAGGHYATETFGIRRLGELAAERFSMEHQFIDVPNPV